VIIIFMLTSSTFTSFLARPDDLDSRSGIVFTVLLSVVAFKYSGATTMPQVSYATILDAYILLNFYMVLMVGTVVFAFSMVCSMGGTNDEDNLERVQKDLLCSRHPGDGYGLDFLPKYDPVVETICGLCFFGVWLGLNAWYWWSVWERIELNKTIISDVSIGWVKFKLEAGAIEGQFPIEKFVKRKEEGKASKATCWDGLLSKFYGPTAAQQTASPHRNTISSLVKVPTENVAGSRKKSTDFFQTVVEFVAQEKAKHKAATTVQSMVRRRKVQSEHHQHYKEIYANRKGSTKDSLVETAM
jgi:hypothetical protein